MVSTSDHDHDDDDNENNDDGEQQQQSQRTLTPCEIERTGGVWDIFMVTPDSLLVGHCFSAMRCCLLRRCRGAGSVLRLRVAGGIATCLTGASAGRSTTSLLLSSTSGLG